MLSNIQRSKKIAIDSFSDLLPIVTLWKKYFLLWQTWNSSWVYLSVNLRKYVKDCLIDCPLCLFYSLFSWCFWLSPFLASRIAKSKAKGLCVFSSVIKMNVLKWKTWKDWKLNSRNMNSKESSGFHARGFAGFYIVRHGQNHQRMGENIGDILKAPKTQLNNRQLLFSMTTKHRHLIIAVLLSTPV